MNTGSAPQAAHLPRGINFDTVLRELLGDMTAAADGWANGRPKDETALLNRITERLSRKRRKCDVGVAQPVAMTAEFYELHRRGPRQTDKFGSDFAVTIRIDNSDPRKPLLFKTAFMQLKVSADYKVSLDSDQLMSSLIPFPLKHRSFVLAVDGVRFGYRIRSAVECLESINQRGSKMFATNEWESLSEWLLGWFSCNRGSPSDPNDPDAPERLLEAFTIGQPEDVLQQAAMQNLPDGYAPARCWLKYTFTETESDTPHES